MTENEHMKHAKDIVWIVRTIWGLAVVFGVAITWGVTLANDVKQNTKDLGEAATSAQMEQVIRALDDIKDSMEAADERQRQMKTQLDKLESKVEALQPRSR